MDMKLRENSGLGKCKWQSSAFMAFSGKSKQLALTGSEKLKGRRVAPDNEPGKTGKNHYEVNRD